MVELKTKGTGLFVFGVLVLTFVVNFYSFAGGYSMTTWLLVTDNYGYYALTSALSVVGMMVALPAVGALSNLIGLRNVNVMGIVILALGGIALQFSSNVFVFMFLRMVASFGAGLITATPYTLIGSVFDLGTAMKYYGLIATANALGCLVGPIVSGILIDSGQILLPMAIWIPLGLVSLAILMVTYPNIKNPGTSFDVKGLALLTVASLALVLWTGLSGDVFPWISAGLILPVVMVVSVVMLARHSDSVDDPAVPLFVFKKYKRFGVAFVIGTFFGLVPTCVTSYLLAYVLGPMAKSGIVGSTASIPYTLVNAVLGLFVGALLAKNFQKNVRLMVVLANVCAVVSTALMGLLQPDSPMILVWVASGIGGVCAALMLTCLTPFFQFGMAPEDYNAAQGMYTFGGTCGAAVFFSVVGVLVNAFGGDTRVAFWCTAVLCAISLAVAILRFRITDEDLAEVAAAQAEGQQS